jgi:hypothetical protein
MRDFYDDCAKLPWGNPSDSTFTNSRKHCSGIGQKHGKQGRGGECQIGFRVWNLHTWICHCKKRASWEAQESWRQLLLDLAPHHPWKPETKKHASSWNHIVIWLNLSKSWWSLKQRSPQMPSTRPSAHLRATIHDHPGPQVGLEVAPVILRRQVGHCHGRHRRGRPAQGRQLTGVPGRMMLGGSLGSLAGSCIFSLWECRIPINPNR